MAYTPLEAAEERARVENKLHRGEKLTKKEERELPYLQQRCTKACSTVAVAGPREGA